jgi:hypothetical protein
VPRTPIRTRPRRDAVGRERPRTHASMMHRRWHRRVGRRASSQTRDRTRSAHRDARRDSRVAIPTIRDDDANARRVRRAPRRRDTRLRVRLLRTTRRDVLERPNDSNL